MIALIRRDLRRSVSSGGATLVIAFFLLVATLVPFAIGPDAALLAKIGGGVIWTAALLAALLPVERLVGPRWITPVQASSGVGAYTRVQSPAPSAPAAVG